MSTGLLPGPFLTKVCGLMHSSESGVVFVALQLSLKEHPRFVKGMVHEGFFQALFFKKDTTSVPLFWQICTTLDTRHKDKAVFITGHSLGTVLAPDVLR